MIYLSIPYGRNTEKPLSIKIINGRYNTHTAVGYLNLENDIIESLAFRVFIGRKDTTNSLASTELLNRTFNFQKDATK